LLIEDAYEHVTLTGQEKGNWSVKTKTTEKQLRRPRHRPFLVPGVLFVGLSVACVGLLVVQSLLGDSSLAAIVSPLSWLATLDPSAALDILANAAEVVAAVLAIAITVIAIVVELAANRYSHQITRLFLREPANVLVLGIFLVTAVQCVWVAVVLDDVDPSAILPLAGFGITLAMVTLSLLLLLPYIYFVFDFSSPISVIERICRDAYSTVLKARSDNVASSQKSVEAAIDELQDVARSAIQQGDRGIAISAVDALAGFINDYAHIRADLPEGWFEITQGVAEDPDFIALAPESLDDVESRGIWVERKIFRRYLSLMGQAAMRERDVANLIGINTQRIATGIGTENEDLLELCIYAFNSYLRATINVRDIRTAYYLMNQFRLVGEKLLAVGQPAKAIEIAGYLREYGQIAHNMGASFLLESAAFYVMSLVEIAVQEDSPALDDLLDCLLQLDMEIREESQEEQTASLLGVRRCQMKLATLFLMRGDDERARRIADDLRGERMERLDRLRRGLLSDDRPQFWELMDLGVNFAYLSPERRPYLDVLFELIKGADRAAV